MKYYEIINKALTFALKENITTTVNKDMIKNASIYFSLNEINKLIPLNNLYLKLLNELEDSLSIKMIDKKASIRLRINKAFTTLKKDNEFKDIINIISDIPINERRYLYNYLNSKLYSIYQNTNSSVITKEIWSAEDSILSIVTEVLPDLFFTKEGNKYLNNFYIKDDDLRNQSLYFAYELANNRLFDEDDNMYAVFYAELEMMLNIYYMSINNKLDSLIKMENYALDKYFTTIISGYQNIKTINFNDNILFNKIITDNNSISYIDKTLKKKNLSSDRSLNK